MATILVAGLAKGSQVYLCQSRPVIDKDGNQVSMKQGEYEYKNKSGKVTGYRRNLPTLDNGSPKPIAGVKLNKIHVKEWTDDQTGEVSTSYSLIISTPSGSHLVNLGGGMVAQNTINSFCSLLSKTKEEIEKMTFSIGFYYNKKSGYNSVSVRDQNGTPLDWYMPPEEQASLIEKLQVGKTDKYITDKTKLTARYKELIEELNKLLPHTGRDQGSVLDDLDDDGYNQSSHDQESDADDVFGGDETPAPKVEDLPFE